MLVHGTTRHEATVLTKADRTQFNPVHKAEKNKQQNWKILDKNLRGRKSLIVRSIRGVGRVGLAVFVKSVDRRLDEIWREPMPILAVSPELSMGPFCVTRPNPTHQLTDQTQPTTSEKIWTQPDPTQY